VTSEASSYQAEPVSVGLLVAGATGQRIFEAIVYKLINDMFSHFSPYLWTGMHLSGAGQVELSALKPVASYSVLE